MSRANSVGSFAEVGIGPHEWPSLVQVQVKDVSNIRNNRDLVLHIILVKGRAVPPYHGMRYLLLFEELPSIILLLKVLGIEAIINVFALQPHSCLLRVFVTAVAVATHAILSILLPLHEAPPLILLLSSSLALLLGLLHVSQLALHVVVIVALVPVVRGKR